MLKKSYKKITELCLTFQCCLVSKADDCNPASELRDFSDNLQHDRQASSNCYCCIKRVTATTHFRWLVTEFLTYNSFYFSFQIFSLFTSCYAFLFKFQFQSLMSMSSLLTFHCNGRKKAGAKRSTLTTGYESDSCKQQLTGVNQLPNSIFTATMLLLKYNSKQGPFLIIQSRLNRIFGAKIPIIPSLLRRCWLGKTKDIQPARKKCCINYGLDDPETQSGITPVR